MTSPVNLTAIVQGQQVTGWVSGNIESSLITPADSFVMRIPFSRDIWEALRCDFRIRVKADGVTMIDGIIGRRAHRSKAGIIEISGRDRVGRLIDESAPLIDYSGMTIGQAVQKLADPFVLNVVIDDAKNRRLRRGKGRRVAAATEPVVSISVRVPRRGRVHPGETRWHLIQEIVSRAGLMAFVSADGQELIISKPNRRQPPQFLFAKGSSNSRIKTTVRDMELEENWEERFSMYLCAGVGGQSDLNYGANVTDKRGVVFDNPFNRLDGTGRDFLLPKRMFLPHRSFGSYNDAQRVAQLEQWRRDFRREVITVECAGMGQDLGTGDETIFCPDTIGRVIFEDHEIDDNYMIVSCSYSFNRDQGDTTFMTLVPSETEIVL